MAKLYEILWKKAKNALGYKDKEVFLEDSVSSGIKARVGSSINFDVMDFRGMNFFVKEIRDYRVGGNQFVDYILLARPIGGNDKWARLRLVPDQNPEGRFTHTAILLEQYDSLAYNEGLHGVVKDEERTGKFVVDDNQNDNDPSNDTHDEYFRVGNCHGSHVATVTVMADEDNSGKVDAGEVKTKTIEFWDYSRRANVDGVEEDQFLFVEMDQKNGWFEIWRGSQISPDNVSVF